MRRAAAAVALAAAALAVAAPAQAAPVLVKVGDFVAPVHVTGSPADSRRLFVVEREGRVRVVLDGRTLDAPFLDITADTLSGGERGLLSIAFAPDYQASGRFYVYLTAKATATTPAGQIQVREYRRADADRADPASGRTVLSADHPRSNHNGGQLQFGPDGRLWIGTGDGGGGNDPDGNGQNPEGRLGKMLRMDPLAGGEPEIFAIGLRNPWRFSFDRQTNDLVIADVGQEAREEVDVAPAATLGGPRLNYGWPCWEGTRRNTAITPECDPPDDIGPVFERAHSAEVCSITGGYVVRDPGLPTLAGRYVYGDVCGGQLRSVALADARSDRAEALAVSTVTSFGEDACGRVYAASLDGPVSRIQDGAATPCDIGGPPPASGGPTPGPGGGADTARPALRTSVNGLRTLAGRRRLRIAVRTDEPVNAVLTGRLRGIASFKTARVRLPAGRTVVKLTISRRTARRLRAALRRKPRVIAALAVTLRDDAGNERRTTRRLKIRRR